MKVIGLFVLATFLLVGCGSTKTYQVEVTNRTKQPVTLWLTKDGPPDEEGWLSPEQLASIRSDRELQYDFQLVDPERTAYTDKLSGQFPGGTHAVLRVYPGTSNYLDLAKIGPDRRVDRVLKSGSNRLVVTEQSGKLVLEAAK